MLKQQLHTIIDRWSTLACELPATEKGGLSYITAHAHCRMKEEECF